jgi:hypothetical protein
VSVVHIRGLLSFCFDPGLFSVSFVVLFCSFLALNLNRVSRIIGFVDSVTDLSIVSGVGSLFPSTTAMAMVLKAQ